MFNTGVVPLKGSIKQAHGYAERSTNQYHKQYQYNQYLYLYQYQYQYQCASTRNINTTNISIPSPSGSKRGVFKFLSVNNIVVALAITASDNNKKAVIKTAHSSKGARSINIPVDRTLKIVLRRTL